MNALRIRNLHKTYKNGVHALQGVDLTVQPGEFFALLGPNGAGKSTAIGIVAGLVNKTSGDVSIFGHNLDRELAAAKSCLGLVPQEFNFNQFEPVEEILINQAGYYGIPRTEARARAEKYLRHLELWDKRRSVARELSGGMKRRLMIARALVHEPKLLILDEPSAGVDIEIRRAMWDFLRDINRNGTSIILTTHYLEEAENLCSNIAIIDHGRTIEHTSMRALLNQLNMETFVLYLADHVSELPACIPGCELRKMDDNTLEVDVQRGHGINRVFETLSAQQIQVLGMRNKANRLEQLFLHLVEKNRSNPALQKSLQQTLDDNKSATET